MPARHVPLCNFGLRTNLGINYRGTHQFVSLGFDFSCETALLGVIGALARVIMVASSSGTRSAMAAGNHAGIHVLLGVL